MPAPGHQVGDSITIFDHPFRICGIVESGKGGRKLIPIDTMGAVIGAEGKASVIYLKSDHPTNDQSSSTKSMPPAGSKTTKCKRWRT